MSPPIATKRKETKFGDYVLGQTLGEGEFGKVKIGWKRNANSQVAIKLIRRDSIGNNPSRLPKIQREITILAQLHHPNIVRLHEMVETDRYIGLILEYASGGELFDYILKHRYLKDAAARRLFAQLVSGVTYLHRKGIVHRDLKLENLLLDSNRNIIITDFGFANTFNPADELGEELESHLMDRDFIKRACLDRFGSDGHRRGDLMQTSCGSPCYAAPELVVSDLLYTGRKVDVWSCGVILYAMLAGYLPFDDDPANPEGDNINLLYKYIVSTPLTFPDYVSLEARDLLKRILVPDPRKRANLHEVASHSWLSDCGHAVTLIANPAASPNDIAHAKFPPVTMENTLVMARSASVRETVKPHRVDLASAKLTAADRFDFPPRVTKTSRDAKRRTVQVEYVAPRSATARIPPTDTLSHTTVNTTSMNIPPKIGVGSSMVNPNFAASITSPKTAISSNLDAALSQKVSRRTSQVKSTGTGTGTSGDVRSRMSFTGSRNRTSHTRPSAVESAFSSNAHRTSQAEVSSNTNDRLPPTSSSSFTHNIKNATNESHRVSLVSLPNTTTTSRINSFPTSGQGYHFYTSTVQTGIASTLVNGKLSQPGRGNGGPNACQNDSLIIGSGSCANGNGHPLRANIHDTDESSKRLSSNGNFNGGGRGGVSSSLSNRTPNKTANSDNKINSSSSVASNHRRSTSTVTVISDKLFGRGASLFSNHRMSVQDTGKKKSDKSYPPTSMSQHLLGNGELRGQRRRSTDSRRTSFSFSRKSSRLDTSSGYSHGNSSGNGASGGDISSPSKEWRSSRRLSSIFNTSSNLMKSLGGRDTSTSNGINTRNSNSPSRRESNSGKPGGSVTPHHHTNDSSRRHSAIPSRRSSQSRNGGGSGGGTIANSGSAFRDTENAAVPGLSNSFTNNLSSKLPQSSNTTSGGKQCIAGGASAVNGASVDNLITNLKSAVVSPSTSDAISATTFHDTNAFPTNSHTNAKSNRTSGVNLVNASASLNTKGSAPGNSGGSANGNVNCKTYGKVDSTNHNAARLSINCASTGGSCNNNIGVVDGCIVSPNSGAATGTIPSVSSGGVTTGFSSVAPITNCVAMNVTREKPGHLVGNTPGATAATTATNITTATAAVVNGVESGNENPHDHVSHNNGPNKNLENGIIEGGGDSPGASTPMTTAVSSSSRLANRIGDGHQLNKNNRKFGDEYENVDRRNNSGVGIAGGSGKLSGGITGHGNSLGATTAGTSGAARRVMDFFRKRSRKSSGE